MAGSGSNGKMLAMGILLAVVVVGLNRFLFFWLLHLRICPKARFGNQLPGLPSGGRGNED